MRLKVLLFSKSKKTTEATGNLIKALKRHGLVKSVEWVNCSGTIKLLGKKRGTLRISRFIDKYRPHLTIVNNADAGVEWVKKCSGYGVVSCVYHDYNSPLKEKALEIGRECDFFYLSNTGQLEEYAKRGVGARYLVRGSSRDVHYPVEAQKGKYYSQVAFIGKPRGKIRMRILKRIEENFDLKVWGPGWNKDCFRRVGGRIGSKKYRIVCSSAKIILGINDGREVESFEKLIEEGGFTSNRDRLVMACGGFFLTNYNQGLEDLYQIGSHLDVYRSLDDLEDKISFYLENPGRRKKIAYQGCNYVHSCQTFDHFVQKVIEEAWKRLPEKVNLFTDPF